MREMWREVADLVGMQGVVVVAVATLAGLAGVQVYWDGVAMSACITLVALLYGRGT